MNRADDIYSLIAEVVREETKYLRHYPAQVLVNVDPLTSGRVQVLVPELGFILPSQAIWCAPHHAGISVPLPSAWVEVYFMAGDQNRPVYLHPCSEIAGNLPAAFQKVPSSRVIFESPATGDCIKYNDLTMMLDIISKIMIRLQNGTEPFVLGNQLVIYLTGLASAAGYTPPPATILSTKIFGA